VSASSLQQLADQLRADRHRSDLSIRGLAAKAGVNYPTILRLEMAQVETPKPDALQKLAAALGTEVEEYYAHVGYLVPTSLPELRPYLRAKYGLGDQTVEKIDEYFRLLRDSQTATSPKENDHETGDQAA